jgi:hypothetical protein
VRIEVDEELGLVTIAGDADELESLRVDLERAIDDGAATGSLLTEDAIVPVVITRT